MGALDEQRAPSHCHASATLTPKRVGSRLAALSTVPHHVGWTAEGSGRDPDTVGANRM